MRTTKWLLTGVLALSLFGCPPADPPEVCNDGVDNNANDLVDCADAFCADDPACQVPAEVCDDGIDNDANGQTDCDDAACSADPACQATCGDGAVNVPGESCDGADLSGQDCVSQGFDTGTLACNSDCSFDVTGCVDFACGNGVVEGLEECDDGNLVDGDGCSSLCTVVNGFEVEANNDTATANNFALLSLNGQMFGDINPVGDVDVFSFEVLAGTTATVTAETLDGHAGTTCISNGVDTQITILDSAAVTIDNDDDGGAGFCSLATGTNLAPGVYFVEVKASSFIDPDVAFDYTLALSFEVCGNGVVEGAEECDGGATCDATCQRIPVCGDGLVDAPEQCDDGNTTAGDGCDASCLFELTLESEPNNDSANANGPFSADTLIAGDVNPSGDSDFYAVVIPAGTTGSITAETLDGQAGTTCASNAVDSLIIITDSLNATLASNDDGGVGFCSLATATGLAAGTYFVQVKASTFDPNLTFDYTLQLTVSAQ